MMVRPFFTVAVIALAQLAGNHAMAQSHCPDVSSLSRNARDTGGKTRVSVVTDGRRWLGQRDRIGSEDWQKMAFSEVSIHDGMLVTCSYRVGDDPGKTLKMMWRYAEDGVSAAQTKAEAHEHPKVAPVGEGRWAAGNVCTSASPADCQFK